MFFQLSSEVTTTVSDTMNNYKVGVQAFVKKGGSIYERGTINNMLFLGGGWGAQQR